MTSVKSTNLKKTAQTLLNRAQEQTQSWLKSTPPAAVVEPQSPSVAPRVGRRTAVAAGLGLAAGVAGLVLLRRRAR